MKREQKAEVIEEVAGRLKESEAVFAVDYRGISVPQVAELRTRLTDAGASFRVVKNTLTIRAADQAGQEDLKEVLAGPTALTFVSPDGDVALAAKALSLFYREHNILAFKGGRMGDQVLSVEQMNELARLPARDVLHGQLVGMIAAPITGLVRSLNGLISGLAIQLRQIADEGMVPRGEGAAAAAEARAAAAAPAAEEAPGADDAPAAEASTAEEAPAAEEASAAEDAPVLDEGPVVDEAAADEAPATEAAAEEDPQTETTDVPSDEGQREGEG
jgi:large subunit ribosomal protein L10